MRTILKALLRRPLVAGPLFLLSCSISSPSMTEGVASGPPDPSEAKVVIYRTDVTGDPTPFPVYADQQLIGYPERGAYFEVHCEPGNHVFSSPGIHALLGRPSDPDAVVPATLEAGKTYYIQAWSSGDGWGAVYAHLKPLTRQDSHWARIERKIGKLQCRVLLGWGTTAPDLLRKLDTKDLSPDPLETRLNPEDGR